MSTPIIFYPFACRHFPFQGEAAMIRQAGEQDAFGDFGLESSPLMRGDAYRRKGKKLTNYFGALFKVLKMTRECTLSALS